MSVLEPKIENIPSELKSQGNWVVWRAVSRVTKDGAPKLDKIPFDPKGRGGGKSNDPKTWGTHEQAVAAYKADRNYAGLGFVFSENDPFVGIDLDKCRNPETGDMEQWALDVIRRMATYTEVSPSGTGVKLFLRGALPEGSNNKVGQVEAYSALRFFTVTGWRIAVLPDDGTTLPGEPQDRQKELDWFANTYLGTKSRKPKALVANVERVELGEEAEPPAEKFALLMEIDPDFKAVWLKQLDQKLPSSSEYDMSLARRAARCGWTDQEITNLIIAFHRKHGLDLKKVSTRHDYIRGTIALAREDTSREGPEAQINERAAHAPPVDGSNDDIQTKWDFIAGKLGIRFVAIKQFKQSPPHYKIYTADTAVDLGGIGNITSFSHFRNAVADQTRHIIPRFKKTAEWDMVVRALAQLWEEVEISDDGTDHGMILASLEKFLAGCSPTTNINAAFESGNIQAVVYQGAWHISLPRFVEYVLTEDKTFTRKKISRILSELGCKSVRVSFTKQDGSQGQVRCWKVPIVKVPPPKGEAVH